LGNVPTRANNGALVSNPESYLHAIAILNGVPSLLCDTDLERCVLSSLNVF